MGTLTFRPDAYFPFSLVLDTSPGCPSLCFEIPLGDRSNGEAVLDILLHVNSKVLQRDHIVHRQREDPACSLCFQDRAKIPATQCAETSTLFRGPGGD